jgi:hypothetical protein
MDSTTVILAGIGWLLFCIGAGYFIAIHILNKNKPNKD